MVEVYTQLNFWTFLILNMLWLLCHLLASHKAPKTCTNLWKQISCVFHSAQTPRHHVRIRHERNQKGNTYFAFVNGWLSPNKWSAVCSCAGWAKPTTNFFTFYYIMFTPGLPPSCVAGEYRANRPSLLEQFNSIQNSANPPDTMPFSVYYWIITSRSYHLSFVLFATHICTLAAHWCCRRRRRYHRSAISIQIHNVTLLVGEKQKTLSASQTHMHCLIEHIVCVLIKLMVQMWRKIRVRLRCVIECVDSSGA